MSGFRGATTSTTGVGIQGIQGPQGPAGPQGIPGIQGFQGNPGVGVQGIQGVPGVKGDTGASGLSAKSLRHVYATGTTGPFDVVIPAGVTEIAIEAWGPGQSATTIQGGTMGGRGGGWLYHTLAVTPGDVLTCTVGIGGIYTHSSTATVVNRATPPLNLALTSASQGATTPQLTLPGEYGGMSTSTTIGANGGSAARGGPGGLGVGLYGNSMAGIAPGGGGGSPNYGGPSNYYMPGADGAIHLYW